MGLATVSFGVAACICLHGASAQKSILMENFDPAQAEGLWYVVQRSAGLYNDSSTCSTYIVKHTEGKIYEVTVDYMGKDNNKIHKVLVVEDDSDHPAQYFFKDQDKQSVAVRVLGTDYKNWNVCFGYVNNGAPVYGIGSRTPVLDPKFMDEITEILKKNELIGTMEKCPPHQQV